MGLPLLHHHHRILSVLKLCAFHLTRGFPIQPFFFLLQVLIEESAIPILMAIKSLYLTHPVLLIKANHAILFVPKTFYGFLNENILHTMCFNHISYPPNLLRPTMSPPTQLCYFSLSLSTTTKQLSETKQSENKNPTRAQK